MMETIIKNQFSTLAESLRKNVHSCGWVKENTAILVVHGIGDQVPLATLDDFARGLIKEYKMILGTNLKLTHEVVAKEDNGTLWFDNVLRLKNGNDEPFIDIYEYYWARYTEDKASWGDLNKWLQGVVDGAKHFYKKNGALGQVYKDESLFFDSSGKFNSFNYRFFIAFVARIFMAVDLTIGLLIKLLSFIPLFGRIAASLAQSLVQTFMHQLTNIIGDVAIYNVVDPKSKFYCVRTQIADGAIGALRFLMERTSNPVGFDNLKFALQNRQIDQVAYEKQLELLDPYYPSVFVAGHSLGSQVAYDAINKLNLFVNEGNISTYNRKGKSLLKPKNGICSQLKGFITFGCPLDKIAFFLRENVPDNQYIRQQMVKNYHGFKQRDLDHFNNEKSNKEYVRADCGLVRYLEEVDWRNYFDTRDYVSGGLDYYTGLTNIDCQFKSRKFDFTHGNYWVSQGFYKDIIQHFLNS